MKKKIRVDRICWYRFVGFPYNFPTALTDDDDNDDAINVEVPKTNEVYHPPYKSDATTISLNDDCF